MTENIGGISLDDLMAAATNDFQNDNETRSNISSDKSISVNLEEINDNSKEYDLSTFISNIFIFSFVFL